MNLEMRTDRIVVSSLGCSPEGPGSIPGQSIFFLANKKCLSLKKQCPFPIKITPLAIQCKYFIIN